MISVSSNSPSCRPSPGQANLAETLEGATKQVLLGSGGGLTLGRAALGRAGRCEDIGHLGHSISWLCEQPLRPGVIGHRIHFRTPNTRSKGLGLHDAMCWLGTNSAEVYRRGKFVPADLTQIRYHLPSGSRLKPKGSVSTVRTYGVCCLKQHRVAAHTPGSNKLIPQVIHTTQIWCLCGSWFKKR